MEGIKKTVLVVEDSPTQALSLLLLLENHGLTIVHAPDGLMALQLAQEKLPDAIVLDVELPGLSGFEVANALSHNPQTNQIPIIMLTRHDDVHSLRKGMNLGAIDYIPKDAFANAVLVETLRYLKIIQPLSQAPHAADPEKNEDRVGMDLVYGSDKSR